MEPWSISNRLPNELWINIFQRLSPRDVFFGVAQTSKRFRGLVRNNTRRLPLIRAHCHVSVTDIDSEERAIDGCDTCIQYIFTTFDSRLEDYPQKRRMCVRGNDSRFRALFIAHKRNGEMESWLESWGANKPFSPQKVDSENVYSLLSYIAVEAIRFDVLKQGKKLLHRMRDERFEHAVEFCETHCGSLSLRSLFLNSMNGSFPWEWGSLSTRRLLATPLESLTVDCMPSLELFSGDRHIPLDRLRTLRLRINPQQRAQMDNMLWLNIDGSFLLSFVPYCVHKLDVSLYNDCSSAITGISAVHMCEFIKAWRSLVHPWRIKNISFNTTTTISEFRTAASYLKMFTNEKLVDIPYCRFRAHHPSDPNMLLELTCYGCGGATQWSIRSGYPNPRAERAQRGGCYQ